MPPVPAIEVSEVTLRTKGYLDGVYDMGSPLSVLTTMD